MAGKSVIHFGLPLSPKTRGLKLIRENYATISNKSTCGKNKLYINALKEGNQKIIDSYSSVYADSEGLIYRDDWCERKMDKIMQNFDLNMQFFECLNHNKFEAEVRQFIKETCFVEISDLNEYSCPGYYVLVLDEYCQVYVGTSKDIKRRIKQHWAGGKIKFDRLLCGPVDRSRLSIDSFRALDTTRILIYPTEDVLLQENDYINFFSDEFICNRAGGGVLEFGLLSLIASIKKREL